MSGTTPFFLRQHNVLCLQKAGLLVCFFTLWAVCNVVVTEAKWLFLQQSAACVMPKSHFCHVKVPLCDSRVPLASCQRATFVMLKCLFVTAECHFRHAKEPLLYLLQQSSVSRLAMSRSRGVCRAWRYMRHDLPRVLTFSTASISAVESSVLPNVAMIHCCQAKKLNASSVKNVRQ